MAGKSVNRSAGSGRFVSKAAAARWPGKTTTEQGVRSKLYEQAQAQIHQQALWLPLAHPTAYALTRKDVEGYQVSPFGRQDFSKVNLK